jgi:uncharacterized OB-fold protein
MSNAETISAGDTSPEAVTDNWQRPAPEPSSFTGPFWAATRERRLLLQYCTVTRRYQHYPRPVSIYTGRKTLEWRPVAGSGHVYAFTITHRAPPAFRGREPYVVATIELDEGVRLMANIVGCEPGAVKVGARVRLAWAPAAGGFNVPVFELSA